MPSGAAGWRRSQRLLQPPVLLLDLRLERARVLLDLLRDRSGETVHLAVLDGPNIVYLFNIESKQALRMHSYLGVHKPAHCTAEGRAMLAFCPEPVLRKVLRAGLAPRTPNTVTDPRALATLLDQVRRNGFALDDEESEVGMRGVAAPVFDASGLAVASVGVVGPLQRFTAPRQRELAAQVLATAEAISLHLGHQPAEA